MIGSTRKRLLIALLFLLPNLAGFLIFTAGPVVFSLWLSFTDFQLTKHNQFSDEPVNFVGFQNYQRLLVGDEAPFFWDYFWNTVFLMIGIPISIFGSLALAIMVNAKTTPDRKSSRRTLALIAAAVTVVTCSIAWAINAPDPNLEGVLSSESGLTDMTVNEVQELRRNGIVTLLALIGIIVTAGIAVGEMFFRAAFYLPTLLAGVAMFLLWKTLYRPSGGLINATLEPVLNTLQATVAATPAFLWYALAAAIALAAVAFLANSTITGIVKLKHNDAGTASFLARLTLSGLLAAILLSLAFITAQLPANSLFTSGYKPLSHAQLTTALDTFEQQFPEYKDTNPTALIPLRQAAETTYSPLEVVQTFNANIQAPPDTPGQDRVELNISELTTTIAVDPDDASARESLTPAEFIALIDDTRQQFIDAYPEEAETLEQSFAELRNTINAAAEHRDVLATLTSLVPDDNAREVRNIVNANATTAKVGLTAGEGLKPPEWLVSSKWAKTALIIMGVWLAIGGGNMLLYLAGLSNVAPELYEASAIDGASGWQRFIHVTWPQLAPTTFFIVIMSTIGGLQGGFEQALVMTQGNYDTIVLTYYLYNLAFDGNFQLGLASAVAWIMFALIFVMTAVNFRFGSRMTND